MRINPIILFLFVFSFCGCFDDKGNYNYHEVAEITIENIPEVVDDRECPGGDRGVGKFRSYRCESEGYFFAGGGDWRG